VNSLEAWLKVYATKADQLQPKSLFMVAEQSIPSDHQLSQTIVGFCAAQEQLGQCLVIDALWISPSSPEGVVKGLLSAVESAAKAWQFSLSWTMTRKYTETCTRDSQCLDDSAAQGGRFLPPELLEGTIDSVLMHAFEDAGFYGCGVCSTFVLTLPVENASMKGFVGGDRGTSDKHGSSDVSPSVLRDPSGGSSIQVRSGRASDLEQMAELALATPELTQFKGMNKSEVMEYLQDYVMDSSATTSGDAETKASLPQGLALVATDLENGDSPTECSLVNAIAPQHRIIGLLLAERQFVQTFYLDALCVRQSHRKRGAGRSLMVALTEQVLNLLAVAAKHR